MSNLPTRPPRRNAETAPFWDGCARGALVLPRCDECGELIWYPRRFCPFCGAASVTQTELSGRGTVYSYTVVRRGAGPFRDVSPYVIAYVELAEGPRLMTNVVGVDPDAVEVGMPVHVVFEPAGESGDAIYRFAPG